MIAERGSSEGTTPPEAGALPPPPALEVPLLSKDPPAPEDPDAGIGAVELPMPEEVADRVVIS